MNKAPELVMIPTPCPECGAIDMDEANEKCRPRTDETGERLCGGEFNDDGVSVRPMDSMSINVRSIAAFEKKKGNEELAAVLDGLAIAIEKQRAEIERLRAALLNLNAAVDAFWNTPGSSHKLHDAAIKRICAAQQDAKGALEQEMRPEVKP
jgi:hypothetical protein